MKKLLHLFLIALLCPLASQAVYKQGYYDKMEGLKKEALKAAAKECVQRHTMLVYTDLPNYWQYSDVYPDLYDGCKRWWDMYSDNIYLIRSGQTARSSFSANKMQREHSVPKSWWKKNGDVEYTPAYSDMWNLYPSDGPANQAKLNYPLGVCKSTTFNNGVSKVGPAQTGYGGGSGNVFEPADEYKGDFARGFFYMALVYDDLPWVVNYMYRQNSWPTLQPWAYQMLLDWARNDRVSQKEIDRNDEVEKYQGNRNPFVDFPELAEYIWGTRQTETFYISEQGGSVTPPPSGDPEITRPVNGSAIDMGEAAVGHTVVMPLEIAGSNLSSALTVRIQGADRNMFYIPTNSISAADINSSDVYLLQVEYRPTSVGVHTATLRLYDGGLPLDRDVAVTLQGQAFEVPQLSTLVATEATEITSTSYQANWEPSPDVIDYYVINRVRYTEDGPQASTLTSDFNYVLVEDRDPDVAESYTVQASRLGVLSEPSNSIQVAAGNDAVIGIGADQPFNIGLIPGGFVVMLDSEHTGMKVYDVSGRVVLERERVCGGETIMLTKGVYLVCTDQHPRPLKIAVE
ncbi:MAG: endonuclease [Muribaculaceae bacterium]|nr:endonuclease [Muribaculaceae bacterium]